MKCIFLHGLGQTSDSWKETIDALDDRVNADCPDLFALPQGGEIDYFNLYQAFSQYCQAYTEPFALCGLSLGGILALQYAVENPDKVLSMALMGTQYRMPKKLLKFQNAIFHMMPKRAFAKAGLGKDDMITLSHSMMDLDFQKDLPKIKCPVLIVCGEKDKPNRQASVQLQERIPNARLTVMEHAGHEINLDVPKELGRVLNHFFMDGLSEIE